MSNVFENLKIYIVWVFGGENDTFAFIPSLSLVKCQENQVPLLNFPSPSRIKLRRRDRQQYFLYRFIRYALAIDEVGDLVDLWCSALRYYDRPS